MNSFRRKSVKVRPYVRCRLGKLEHVRKHLRRWPR